MLFWESGCMPVTSITEDLPSYLSCSQKRLNSCHLRTDVRIWNAGFYSPRSIHFLLPSASNLLLSPCPESCLRLIKQANQMLVFCDEGNGRSTTQRSECICEERMLSLFSFSHSLLVLFFPLSPSLHPSLRLFFFLAPLVT